MASSERRGAFDGHFRGLVRRRLVARLALDERFDGVQAIRRRRHTVDHHACLVDRRARNVHRRGNVDEGEVPHLAIADLLEVVALARPGRRDANRGQQIAGLQ